MRLLPRFLNVVVLFALMVLPAQAQVTYVGATNNLGTNNTISVNKPGGVAAGDLVIIQAGYTVNTGSITAPTGFETLYNTQEGNLEGAVFYRFLDGSEGATFTMALGSNRNWVVAAVAYRNVNRTNPFEDSQTTQSNLGNGSNSVNAPSATAASPATRLVSLMLQRHTTTMTGFTADGAMTSRTSRVGGNRGVLIADQALGSAGATGTRTHDFTPNQGGGNAGNRAYFATSIVLRAAPTDPNSGLSGSPTTVVADGSSASTITVTVRDGANSPIVGLQASDFQFTGQSAASLTGFTDAGGGTYTYSLTNTTIETVNLNATVSNVGIGSSGNIQFILGPPSASNSSLNASPTSVSNNGISYSLLTISLRSGGNQPITGKTSGDFIFSGEGSADIGTFTDLGGGDYSFRVTNFTAEVLNISLTVEAVNLGGFPTITFTNTLYLYSYQSGSWDNLNTWTLDPSGTTLTGSALPGVNDNVVILNGRTVTKSSGSVVINELTIQNGGFLDLTTTTGHTLGEVMGQGRLRLASLTFPGGTFTGFVSAGGGTLEYYNVAGTLPTGVPTYNNLVLTNTTASNNTLILNSNVTVNGSLVVQRTGSGTLTLQHGNSTTARSMSIGNGVSIGAGTSWTVVNTTQNNHTVSVVGHFINNGTVRFTNQGAPNYTAATTTGAVRLTMTGNVDSDMVLNGTTDLYQLILDKGTDRTFVLNVSASNSAHFRLFGPNNTAESGAVPNIQDGRALDLRTGTLRLGNNIVIPSLVSGSNLGYRIDEDVMLWLDGAQVTTNHAPTFNNPAALVPYGALRVSGGSVLTDNSTQGIVTREKAVILIEGGTVTTVAIRTSFFEGVQRGAFTMTGGTVTIDGTLPEGFGTSMALYAPLFMPYPDNTFTMSGGTLNILNSNPLTGQSGTNFSMVIGALPDNIDVTGGTINITVPSTRPAYINTSAPFHNLNILSTSTTYAAEPRQYLRTDDASYGVEAQPTVPFTLAATDLDVRNNLSVQANAHLSSGSANKNLFVGGNFNLVGGGVYTPGTNRTTFNGSIAQTFTLNGTITSGLFAMEVDKSADTLRLAGSTGTLIVRDDLDLTAGVFLDAGKTVEVRGDLSVSGTHGGTGKIQLTTLASRTVTGNGSGVLGSLDVSGPASAVTVALATALRINGMLTFVPSGTNNRILDIGTYNLTFGPSASTSGASGPTGALRFIRTNGLQSAGGVTKIYNGLSFTFPIGTSTSPVRYTPATISFDTAPTAYGSITIRPVANEHPNVTEFGRSLTYYWRTTSTGFTLGSAKVLHAYTYPDANVVTGSGITEDAYVSARYNPSNATWTTGSATDVDEVNNIAAFTGPTFETTIDGEYTAGDNAPLDPFGTVQIYYSYTDGGAWSNVNTWSLDGHTGPQNIPATAPNTNSVVRIGNNNTVVVTANGAVAGSLTLENGSTLDLGTTTGHNFGSLVGEQIAGSGRLRISSAVATAQFPAGDFSQFIGATGGTVEYYRTTTNFTVPTTSAAPTNLTLDTYRYLVMNVQAGAGGIINFPAQDLRIFEDLEINGLGGTFVRLANSVSGDIQVDRDILIQGSGLYYRFDAANTRIVNVDRNVVIASGAAFGTTTSSVNVVHDLIVGGSITNNGTYNLHASMLRHTRLTFVGAANASFGGTNGSASTTINQLTINKGTSPNSVLDFSVAGTATFQATNNWLTLTNGMFRLSRASTITVSSAASAYTILASTGLSANHASAVINIGNTDSDAADLSLGGRLEVLNGVINIGNTNNFNQDIEYASAGLPEIVVAGGELNVNGQLRRFVASSVGSLVWRQSGGVVTIRGRNQQINNAKLEIANAGSVFEMSAGTIRILRSGSISYADLYLRPATHNVTGGTILFSPVGSIGNQTYTIDATTPLWNLDVTAIDGSNTATLTVNINNLVVRNNLTVSNLSTLNMGVLNLTVGGTFLKQSTGTFNRGVQTVTFNGVASVLDGTFTTQSFHNLSVATGASLTLAASTPVVVSNNLTIGVAGQLADGGNLIEVRATVDNEGAHVSASNSAAFGIEMDGSSPQYISGNGDFGNLIIRNSLSVFLQDSIRVNRRLELALGVLDLGEHRLELGQAAEVTGTFSASRMLRSNGVLSDGGVLKEFVGTGSFLYPIGVFGKYTPATLNVTATSAPGTITVKAINAKHPSTRDAADKQLNFYWNVTRTGFSAFTATHTYVYRDSDVTGTESAYTTGRFVFPNWTPLLGIPGTLNTSTNTISLVGVNYINGDYTAGEDIEFTGVDTYYSRNGLSYPVDWSDPNSWSTDIVLQHNGAPASTPPVGAPMIVATGHTIRMDGNFRLAESVALNGTATLDLEDSYGHNLGVVTGTGVIRIKATASNQFVFPGGNYDGLNGPGGGTTEFYDDVDGILPTQTFYHNVRFIGNSERQQSNADITVYGNWSLESGTVDNAGYNKTVALSGDWLNTASASAYVPGTGKVVLAKTTGSQLIGGDYGTTFGFLELNGAAVKQLQQSIQVNNGVIFTNGNLVLGTDSLTFGPTATVTGTPSATSMLVVSGSGIVRKRFSVVGSFTIPVGDSLGTDEYSPIVLTLNTGTLGGSASVDVKVTDGSPPSCGGSSFITRYWNLSTNDLTDFNLTATASYRDADVVGTEANIYGIYKVGAGPCELGSLANAGANTVTVVVTGSPVLITGGNTGFIAEPTVQANNLLITNVGTTSMQLAWTDGNGTNRLVLIRVNGAVDAVPTDATVYTPDTDFSGSPQEVGTGNFVLYTGTGSGFTVTGLDMNTRYHFAVFEFNELGGNTNYLVSSPATGSARTQVQLSVMIEGNQGWRMVGSPVRTVFADLTDGFHTQGFTGATYPAKHPNLLWYDETYAGTDNQRWRKPANLADSVVAGRGYMFYVFGEIPSEPDYDDPAYALPKALEVTGPQTPLTAGTFSFPVTYTTAADSGWNLVANPLASTIDWDHASWTKTNLDNSVYVWSDSANAGLGDYLYWNGTTGSLGDGLIAPMQAFWVKANADSPELVIDEAAATTGGTFYRHIPNDSIPVLEFTITSGNWSKKTYLMFSENGKKGMDPWDAWHLVPMNPDFLEFYTEGAEGQPLSIQHLPRRLYRTAETAFHVGGWVNGRPLSGTYEIRLTGARNLPEMWEVSLFDRTTKRTVRWSGEELTTSFLIKGDTTQALPPMYWQEAGGQPKAATGRADSRFLLRVDPNGEFDDIPGEITLDQNYPNPFNPTTRIRYSLPEDMQVRLEVFDVLGRRVATVDEGLKQVGYHTVEVDMGRYASGVYLYRLVTGERAVVRKMTLIR